MKDYKQEEEIVKDYTASTTDEQIYELDYNCAEVVELMQTAVKKLSIPDVVHQREQFKSMVFDMANKLAIAGHGDEAVSMHRIHNRL